MTITSSAELQLRTLFVLDAGGRMTSPREPGGGPAPALAIVRSATACAWAVRADLPERVAAAVARLAREEPPVADLRRPPRHADRYVDLVGGKVVAGPAFAFPERMTWPAGVVAIDDERLLGRHFGGWVPGELAAGRAPLLAVVEDGQPVSICFCARRSPLAAEAGLETAAPFRGVGHGPRVAAAWALAVRASGRLPLYSTSWSNDASLAVARKLRLVPYACDWSLLG